MDQSPDGRFLAVGEIGYSPRVNIFSTLAGATADVPLSIISEHSFGVRCVAFSSNSQWLATLGDVNDGFLFVWSINLKTGAVKLHFTNKCTASVLDMAWCGNKLVTVGTRHVKVWRVEEPSSVFQTKQGRSLLDDGNASPGPKTLSGRNSLLGVLADSTFTCVAPISDYEAVLCTNTGIVCLLDDTTGNQALKYTRQLGCPTQSLTVDLPGQMIWFANGDGQIESESFERLRSAAKNCPVTDFNTGKDPVITSSPSSPTAADPLCPFPSPPRSGSRKHSRRKGIVASRCLPNRIVSIDDDRHIRVDLLCHGVGPVSLEQSTVITLPAHNEAVQGVVSLSKKNIEGDYITWSHGGYVNFWSLDGSLRRSEKIELAQPEPSSMEHDGNFNELKLIRASDDGRWIVSGDLLGVLLVVECQSWTPTIKTRTHSAEMTDIALHPSEQSLLVATSSRDRTVQLLQHRDEEFKLVQTFDDHVGAVSAVSFVDDFLVSASSDRTVIIRQRLSRTKAGGPTMLAYVSKRIITLKASPTSIAFPEPHVLVVSTMDRQILTFSITAGVAINGFKAFDSEGEDAVILSSLSISSVEDSSGFHRILAGFSSTDKSIRLYDFDRGILLAKELGHTEGISDVTVVDDADDSKGRDRKALISTGVDGLIMVWGASTAPLPLLSTPLQELSQGQAVSVHDSDSTSIRDSILRQPPLRKVLSKLELADIAGFVPRASASHDQSPPRLKNKTSRYSLAPGKLNGLSAAQSRSNIVTPQGEPVAKCNDGRTESLPPSANTIINQTSLHRASPPPTDMARCVDAAENDHKPAQRCLGEQSPSPHPAPQTLPTTAKATNRANKGRLRRPPSIPSDLRGQSHVKNRRKSMGQVNEFGSIGMASEQVCRTLRAYRKKIQAAPRTEHLQLDEVEVELLATLRTIEECHDRIGSRRTKAATENELDNLATLTQSSGLGPWSAPERNNGS